MLRVVVFRLFILARKYTAFPLLDTPLEYPVGFSAPHLRSKLGALAQLGEHLLCKQGVTGSIPVGSTIFGI